jgi:hypothetical protein
MLKSPPSLSSPPCEVTVKSDTDAWNIEDLRHHKKIDLGPRLPRSWRDILREQEALLARSTQVPTHVAENNRV